MDFYDDNSEIINVLDLNRYIVSEYNKSINIETGDTEIEDVEPDVRSKYTKYVYDQLISNSTIHTLILENIQIINFGIIIDFEIKSMIDMLNINKTIHTLVLNNVNFSEFEIKYLADMLKIKHCILSN